MLISDYDYDLPSELIAQRPLDERSDSSLLVYDGAGQGCRQLGFDALPGLLAPGDLVIANDTRVIPARLFARKPSGGRVEIMLERILDAQRALVQLRSNKSVKPGQLLEVGEVTAEVTGREDRFFIIEFRPDPSRDASIEALFDEQGAIPLPPYIQRSAEPEDQERYQTVYSSTPGAVAAPTAGLHIDDDLIDRLKARGIGWDTVTLHVGAGTFLPVSADRLDDHVMHAERVSVSAALCDRIAATRAAGGSIVAIGTTVVRALESAAVGGELEAFEGETSLFIKPGFRFRVVDQLITNFHLPKSTLLVLVSSFAGHERIREMYRFAITSRMRFFSYGDAMLLRRQDAI